MLDHLLTPTNLVIFTVAFTIKLLVAGYVILKVRKRIA